MVDNNETTIGRSIFATRLLLSAAATAQNAGTKKFQIFFQNFFKRFRTKSQIRVTLKQMTDVYILLEACGARRMYTAQICLTKLLAQGAFRIVADPNLVS